MLPILLAIFATLAASAAAFGLAAWLLVRAAKARLGASAEQERAAANRERQRALGILTRARLRATRGDRRRGRKVLVEIARHVRR